MELTLSLLQDYTKGIVQDSLIMQETLLKTVLKKPHQSKPIDCLEI
jgi:hypothetical protein